MTRFKKLWLAACLLELLFLRSTQAQRCDGVDVNVGTHEQRCLRPGLMVISVAVAPDEGRGLPQWRRIYGKATQDGRVVRSSADGVGDPRWRIVSDRF
jgi:hypothetical protein